MQENSQLLPQKNTFTAKKAILIGFGCAVIYALLMTFALLSDTLLLTNNVAEYVPRNQIFMRLMLSLLCILYIKRDTKHYRIGFVSAGIIGIVISLLWTADWLLYVLIKLTWKPYMVIGINLLSVAFSDCVFLALIVYLLRKANVSKHVKLWFPILIYGAFTALFFAGGFSVAIISFASSDLISPWIVKSASMKDFMNALNMIDVPVDEILNIRSFRSDKIHAFSVQEILNASGGNDIAILNVLRDKGLDDAAILNFIDNLNINSFSVFKWLTEMNFGMRWHDFAMQLVALPLFVVPFYLLTNNLYIGTSVACFRQALVVNFGYLTIKNEVGSGIVRMVVGPFTEISYWLFNLGCGVTAIVITIILICKEKWYGDTACEYEKLDTYHGSVFSVSSDEALRTPKMLIVKFGAIGVVLYTIFSLMWDSINEISLAVLGFIESYITGRWFSENGIVLSILIHLVAALAIFLLVLFIRLFIHPETKLKNAEKILGEGACWLLVAGALALMIVIPIVGLKSLVGNTPEYLWDWHFSLFTMRFALEEMPILYTLVIESILAAGLVVSLTSALSLHGVFYSIKYQKALSWISVIGLIYFGCSLISSAFYSFEFLDLIVMAIAGVICILFAGFIKAYGIKEKAN